jgi:etoposide-induced 2.4 mRNA
MTIYREVWKAARAGLIDSVSFHKALVVLVRCAKVRSKLFQCLLLNGIIFLGSIMVFNWILGPLLGLVIGSLLPSQRVGLELQASMTLWISWVYYSLWIAPLYIVTFILNTIWYRDIAIDSVELFAKHSSVSGASFARSSVQTSIPNQIADILLRSLFNIVYLGYLTVLAPYRSLYAISLAFLISFNAFEFKYRQLNFSDKVDLIESHWVYFLSFSIWVAVLVTEFPTMVENGLLGVLFPFLLINASSTGHPVPVSIPSDPLPRLTLGWLSKLRVFFIVRKLTDGLVYLINVYNTSKKPIN